MPDPNVTIEGDVWKLPDGSIVRRKTKRLRLVIQRQRYSYKGEYRYNRSFHLEKQVGGRTVCFPLGTDARKAAEKADEIGAFLALPASTLDQARKLYDPRGEARSAGYATIREVFDAHTAGFRSLGISEKSGRGYQYALVQIMRHVEAHRKGKDVISRPGAKLDWSPWTKQCTTVLTAKQLIDFKTLWLDGLEDEEEILTAQITCDSFMRQARSIFSRDAMKYYRQACVTLPDLTDWMDVGFFGARKFFELQPVATIRAVFESMPELKKADPNAWRACMLCVHMGLRKAEAAAMKWSWVEVVDGTPRVNLRQDGTFAPKHGTGRRVTFKPWVWEALQASRDSLDTVISGTDTERTEGVFARLNAWLKKRGIGSEKPTHELRKCWVSYIAKTEGMLAAQKMAGHRDPKTTTTHYADNLLPDELKRYWEAA